MWETPLNLLKAEIVQREYEGYPVPDAIKDRVKALGEASDPDIQAEIDDINQALVSRGDVIVLRRNGS